MKNFDASPPDGSAYPKPTPGDDKPASNADPKAAPRSVKHLPPAPVSADAAGTFEHKILMSSLNGIYIYDLETGVNTFLNPQYTRLTGYVLEDLQDLTGAELLALIHPEDRKRVAAHMGRIGRAGDDETLEIEYRFKTADGRWMWCLAKEAVFERGGNGRVRRVIGTFLDISDRKTAGKKLEHERELLQKLIETIPVMITIYDPALQCFSFNREFRKILGWSEQDLHSGDPMEKFYADPAEREAARQFMESLETGWRTFKVTARDGDSVESAWANIRLSDDTRVGIGIDIRNAPQS
jgi:PAS domain S-box-containing protein